MRGVVVALVAALTMTAFAPPAEAAIVYTRDGKVTHGALHVAGRGLVVTVEGRTVTIPYDQVLGISMDGQALFPAPQRAEESKVLNNDWVLWTLVLANVATVVAAGFTVYRLATPTTPVTR